MSNISKEEKLPIRIAYIGGGSMSWARVFMTDLALETQLCGEIRLYDTDFDAAKHNETIGNALTANDNAPGDWEYKAVSSLQEALTGADFVIISILPGTLEHMRSDVHLPERLGIYQSVGDTTGPGGIIRALRTVPVLAQFAGQIRQYAPNAWVINYTNPMSLCMRALHESYPQIKAIGCCHEVFAAQELLAAIVKNETGADVSRSDIYVNVFGLNHFTWLSSASYREYDLMPLFEHYSSVYYDSGFEQEYNEQLDKVFRCNNRVKFDLFRKYGLIAAAGDRHLAEFFPGEVYLRNRKSAERWGFMLTDVNWRIADREEKIKRTQRLISAEETPGLKPSGEEGVLIIKALCGLTRIVTNVNMPNTHLQIGNLPKDTVVETNALISRDDVRPVMAGDLPDKIHSLMDVHIENQSEVLHAALSCDREGVLRAFERDPLVRGRSPLSKQCKLVDEMIKNTLDALPDEWKNY